MRTAVMIATVLAWACGQEAYGPPALLVLAQTELAGTVGEPLDLVIRVLDREDRPVPGVRLTATVLTGSLGVGEAASDGAGEVRFVWTLDTLIGIPTVDVSLDNGALAIRLFGEAHPGVATRAEFTTSVAVTSGGVPFAFPVQGWDRWGNVTLEVPIRSPALGVIVDSARWTPQAMGRAQFVIDLPSSDTLDVYIHPPSGSYRAGFRIGDTVWVERGRLVPDTTPAAAICPVPATALSTIVYRATDVVRIRRVSGWADTVTMPVRVGALIHVLDTAAVPSGNASVLYRPLGRDAAPACDGTQFVRPWRFAIAFALADSLVITPD